MRNKLLVEAVGTFFLCLAVLVSGGPLPVAALFASTPINDTVSVGLGVFSPGGGNLNYKKDWFGRNFVDSTAIETVNINPSLSIRFDDKHSIGLGVSALVGHAKLKQQIDAEDNMQAILIRDGDYFVPLGDRVKKARAAKADLFISIHCNDMPVVSTRYISGYVRNKKGKKVPVYKTRYAKSTSTRGVETFVSGSGRLDEQDDVIKRENASMFLEENYKENYQGFDANDPESAIILSLMKNTFRTQSLKLAKLVQDEYVKVGRVNRGVQEKSLAVLARAGMPAILTEIGFISNPGEEDYMNSEDGQAEITNCLLKAIQAYKTSVEI